VKPRTHKATPSLPRLSAARRGYGYRWQKLSKLYLDSNPLCVACKARGRVEGATVVDHIIPHRGDSNRMWEESNWQSMCKPCHYHKTATYDGAFDRPVISAGKGASHFCRFGR